MPDDKNVVEVEVECCDVQHLDVGEYFDNKIDDLAELDCCGRFAEILNYYHVETDVDVELLTSEDSST